MFLSLAVAASGAEDCTPCHRKQTQAYVTTGMAQSISVYKSRTGEVGHAFSESRFLIKHSGRAMLHRIERRGLVSEQAVALTMGSGRVGQSFGVVIGDRLFESPVSWFSQSARWGMSPGYEMDVAPEFDRKIEAECLFCHTSGRPASVVDLKPIACENCHPAALPGHFSNPARLPPLEQDRGCEACHLQGEARVLDPGQSWSDPRPSFTTYVSSPPPQGLRVVSQVEQLALSKCVRESAGKLRCGSCHNPHGAPKPVEQVCAGCHAGRLSNSHVNYRDGCVRCHMPRQPTPEVAHTAYTNHRIQIPGSAEAVASGDRALRAWREPPAALRERGQGLAYVYAGQREESAEWVQKGFVILLALRAKDAAVYSALGSVLMQKSRPAEAVQMYDAALRLRPADTETAHNLAVAELAAGNTSGAIDRAERAISIDPYYERSWLMLVGVYTHLDKPALRAATIERYLKLVPQNLTFRTLQRAGAPKLTGP